MSRRKKLLLSVAVIWLAATVAISAVILLITGQDISDLAEIFKPDSAAEFKSAKAAVTVIDVGQGSSLLIRLFDGDKSILIDSGDSFAGDDGWKYSICLLSPIRTPTTLAVP